MDGHRPAQAGAQNPAYMSARPPPHLGEHAAGADVNPKEGFLNREICGSPEPGSPAFSWYLSDHFGRILILPQALESGLAEQPAIYRC